MARFDEVRRHSAAHVAEADECDFRHPGLLREQQADATEQKEAS
jgi:hypothetical protein